MSVYDVEINSLIDTGANCSVIKESIAKNLGCHFSPYYLYLRGIGIGGLQVFAKIKIPVKFEDFCIRLDVFVVKDSDFCYDLLIGRNAIQHPDLEIVTNHLGSRLVRKHITTSGSDINIIWDDPSSELSSKISHLDNVTQGSISAIFLKYPSVLNSNGHVKTGELVIKLKRDEVIYYRPYRLAPIEREKVKEIIQELLDKHIIKESNSSFASPMILVKKKDGSDRMCIDYRALNKLIEKDRYPLPLIEDQIDRLGNSKFYISIDMKNGFYQIPVSSNSTKYTAFVTPDGHYEFLKMPFGICNGPSVFQRAITKAVYHLKFLLVYIDDILIPFNTIEQGLDYLEQTVSALNSSGFTINIKKCKFFVDSIEYLGRHISRDGVRPSETKVSALAYSPVPSNIKQVRQFMGLSSYFRRFIPDFASRTACITKLTKANQKWEWGPEQDLARNYVINHLISKPLLTIFNPELPTELHTDASSIGFGAILLQKIDNTNKVVAYYSKRTSPTESRYCSYDLETLAIYNALKYFRVYLLGIQFTIITDCNAIKSTMSKRDISPRVARWWTYMQDFQFNIQYKKGKFISHVDFLSRNPVDPSFSTRGCSLPEVNIIEASQNNNPDSWLKIAQTNDSETQTLISRLASGDVDSNQYLMLNDLLHYKTSPDAEPKLFVPKGYRLSILKLYHDETCHAGFDKVFHKIRQHFWFPGMAVFIKKYILHCLICTEKKGCAGPKQGLLHPIDKTAIPFHTIHLDCTGPFTMTTEGFRHILLLVDGFTKFCLLRPLKALNAGELIPIIRETITMFGTPSLVITDRGTNFSSNQIRYLFRELNVEHHMIATGTPRSNGQVERYVSTVINMLSTICNNQSEWSSKLPKVQLSINTTIQKSTGFSPLRLLIGVEANVPLVQARLNEIPINEPNIDVQAERALAKQRLQQVAAKFKQRFDSVRRNNKNFNIGDLVFVSQDHRRNDKLQPKFKGPYEIVSVLPNDRYVLRGRGNMRNIVIAKEKLRFWPGEWIDNNIAVEHAM